MEPEKKSNGAFVGLIVIIIILIIGGIYMWASKEQTQSIQSNQAQSEAVTNQDAASLSALEQDSNTTDTSTGVDANAVQ